MIGPPVTEPVETVTLAELTDNCIEGVATSKNGFTSATIKKWTGVPLREEVKEAKSMAFPGVVKAEVTRVLSPPVVKSVSTDLHSSNPLRRVSGSAELVTVRSVKFNTLPDVDSENPRTTWFKLLFVRLGPGLTVFV